LQSRHLLPAVLQITHCTKCCNCEGLVWTGLLNDNGVPEKVPALQKVDEAHCSRCDGISPAARLQGQHDTGCLGQYSLAQHKVQTCAEMRHRHIVSDAPGSRLFQSNEFQVAGAASSTAVFRISRFRNPARPQASCSLQPLFCACIAET